MDKRKTQKKIRIVAKFTEDEYTLMMGLVGEPSCVVGDRPASAQFSKGTADDDVDGDGVEWRDANSRSMLRLIHYSEGDTDPKFDKKGDYIPTVYASIYKRRLGREMLVNVIRIFEQWNIHYEVDETDAPSRGEVPVVVGSARVH